jgi:dimeric dUTPase (all-alpha-NTP-PPase superfamily)
MASLWINFIYRLLITSVVASSALWLIRLVDNLGIEIHFMRFAYWTLVDSVDDLTIMENVGWDLHILCSIVIPLQLAALKFLCVSLDQNYDARLNAIVAPLAFVAIFCFKSYDVLFMGI